MSSQFSLLHKPITFLFPKYTAIAIFLTLIIIFLKYLILKQDLSNFSAKRDLNL